MLGRRTVATAAMVAAALMSPAAALASGGSGSGGGSTPKVAECAQLTNLSATAAPRLNWPGLDTIDASADVVNCGTAPLSVSDLEREVNLTTGIVQYNGVVSTPRTLAPGESYPILFGDSSTLVLPGQDYQIKFSAISATTGRTLDQHTFQLTTP